jgi:flagellar secretion chaperone FliS
MALNNPYSAYRTTQTSTTTGHLKLIVMLHDGAIRFLAQAASATKQKDYTKKSLNLNKAIAIIDHLWSSLDLEKGGEIASNLASIFAYAHKRLILANFNDDADAMEEIIQHIRSLRESWAIVDAQSKTTLSVANQPKDGADPMREQLAMAA